MTKMRRLTIIQRMIAPENTVVKGSIASQAITAEQAKIANICSYVCKIDCICFHLSSPVDTTIYYFNYPSLHTIQDGGGCCT